MDNEQQALNDEGRALWDQKAAFWDTLHGDAGNKFHRQLVSPAVERLLALRAGERVLDIACGSGVMARRLAELGGRGRAARRRASRFSMPSWMPPTRKRWRPWAKGSTTRLYARWR